MKCFIFNPFNQPFTYMKDLKKMSEVFVKSPKSETKKIKLFDHIQGKKSQKLLKGLIMDSYRNDSDASKAIYKLADKPEKKFSMLKGRLKKKMVDEVLHLKTHSKKRSPYEAALNEAYRNLSISKTLLTVGMRAEAMEVVRLLFQEAVRYRFTEVILSAARMLRYNASLQGTGEELLIYDKAAENARLELDAEIESEKVMEDLNLEIRFSYSNRQDLLNRISVQNERLKALTGRFQSHVLRLNSYRIGIRYFEYNRNFRGMIEVCEACEQYIDANPQFRQNSRYAEMALFKMDACLHLQDYRKGQEYASVCLRYFNRGYPNWFVFMEYFFLLCLQTRNYESSIKIFRDVTSHAKFRNLTPERKEKWKLFEAYLNFAVPLELADPDFKLYKFINEVPIYNKDKKGYNVSILIAQFMLLLNMKDMDRLLLKKDSFNSYFSRYINKNVNYRSYYFAKMLMIVLRYNFNPLKSRAISQKFLVKLKARTNRYRGDLESLEVIPYEQLWKEVISRLESLNAGSKYFNAPQKTKKPKKQLSKNLLAAMRYKSAGDLVPGQVKTRASINLNRPA